MAKQKLLGENHSFNKGMNIGVADPSVAGMTGIVSDFSNWSSAAKMVKQRLISVLIQEPTGMALQDDGQSRIQFLKELVEVSPKSVTGLNRSITAAYGESPVSNGGEQMEYITKNTRERSVPTFVWDELEGKPITTLIEDWMVELLQDPDTGFPGIIAKAAYEDAGSPHMGPQFKSMTVLFIEPNANLTAPVSAYLCTNMMPKGFTDESSYEAQGELQGLEQTVEFTALTMHGRAVRVMAQEYLNSINKAGLMPGAQSAFIEGISTNADDTAAPVGQRVAINEVADSL